MNKLILAFSILLLAGGCGDILDIEDINNYRPEEVWNDENLATAYMANLYPMFGNWSAGADRLSKQLAGIEFYADRVTISNGDFKSWNYNRIRLINQAIVDVNGGDLPQETKDGIVAQALFMRAYAYFDMVIHHGGIPYIKVPQDRYEDDLFVSRNTTEESFQFIVEDLDQAIALLPQRILPTSSDYGKIDGNFAQAFKAKVLLYKASPQFNPSNPWDSWNQFYTGFFILKNSMLELTQEEVQQYDVDYVVMRLAEVMLNYAETANETGNFSEAMEMLRLIRDRAGIEPGPDGNFGITAGTREQMREAILDERNIELSFEGHRFWDLRRLRMLDRLDGTTKYGVEAIAINENGEEMPISEARDRANEYELEPDDFKYSLLQVPRSGVQVNVLPENYYFFPIQESVVNRNTNLEQNIGWGGTFDPTLE